MFVSQVVFLQTPWDEVVNKDVRISQEPLYDLLTFWFSQIDGHTIFVAVQ